MGGKILIRIGFVFYGIWHYDSKCCYIIVATLESRGLIWFNVFFRAIDFFGFLE